MEGKVYKLIFRSIAVIVATFICALIFNIIYQAQLYYTKLAKDSKITAFVFKGYENSSDEIRKQITALQNVKGLEFVSSGEIYQNISNGTSKIKGILLNGENPFSPYFLINLKDFSVESVENIKNTLMKIKGIEEVKYDPQIFVLTDKLNKIKTGYLAALFTASMVLLISLISRFVYELSNFYAKLRHYILEIAWGTG